MAGIYLHVPFCRQACTYCDFHFSTNLKRRDDMVDALVAELHLRKGFFLEAVDIGSIYFGGGTPSVLDPAQVARLIGEIAQAWPLDPDAEITLEANPDDLDPKMLSGLRSAGVNRLSIGVQSFHEHDLRAMNRSHNAQQAAQAVRDAKAAGFDNITIDLIYGIPGLSMEAWQANIDQAIALDVPHVSAYALTVEKKTALAKQVKDGTLLLPPDDAFSAQYLQLIDRLKLAGIQQYELSNFAKPGMEARHNAAYWRGVPYLGLGPSAHSFDGQARSWNHANNARYLKETGEGLVPVLGSEQLGPADQLNEYIMTGLRKVEGINLDHIRLRWGKDLHQLEAAAIQGFIAKGYMRQEGDFLKLSGKGFLVSDHIIANLFQID